VDPPGCLPVREFGTIGDVGGPRDLVLVTCDQNVIFRRDQVRLDEIGTHLDRQLVGSERVLGPVAAGAPVGDDDGGQDEILYIGALVACDLIPYPLLLKEKGDAEETAGHV